jgi:hypothetical protein
MIIAPVGGAERSLDYFIKIQQKQSRQWLGLDSIPPYRSRVPQPLKWLVVILGVRFQEPLMIPGARFGWRCGMFA